MKRHILGMIAVTFVAAASIRGQEALATAVQRTDDATLRMEFRARPGVCGSGQAMSFDTRGRNSRNGEWTTECEPGPVRVAMDVRNGQPAALRFYVGGQWSGAGAATDIGRVSARDAGDWFARLAETGIGAVARDAITISTLADSAVVWPVLLRIAKNDSRERELRKSAVFWLGQTAAEATAALNGIAEAEDEDVEVRKQAVFALSQRPAGEGVSALLRIARSKLDARVRRQAIFWLGQSGDPRALSYFEAVLARP